MPTKKKAANTAAETPEDSGLNTDYTDELPDENQQLMQDILATLQGFEQSEIALTVHRIIEGGGKTRLILPDGILYPNEVGMIFGTGRYQFIYQVSQRLAEHPNLKQRVPAFIVDFEAPPGWRPPSAPAPTTPGNGNGNSQAVSPYGEHIPAILQLSQSLFQETFKVSQDATKQSRDYQDTVRQRELELMKEIVRESRSDDRKNRGLFLEALAIIGPGALAIVQSRIENGQADTLGNEIYNFAKELLLDKGLVWIKDKAPEMYQLLVSQLTDSELPDGVSEDEVQREKVER